jgi:glycosyltransferase involved in cell wall biosynthesis
MSVLHLLGSSAQGGAETYFVDLAAALHRGGVAQGALIRPHDERTRRLRALGLRVENRSFAKPFDFTTRAAATRMAAGMGARVLLAWMSRAASLTPSGPWARIARLGNYYDLKSFRGFDMLVGNTLDIAEWIVGQGWPAQRVCYIPNFAAAGEAAPLARSAFDTPQDAPLLLAIGRLHTAKAHDVSLRALARLPGVWLWIAGEGPLLGELQALAAELGVADRVRFLGWRTDAPALYRTADVCVFPSRFEPLGNVVLQAWAHGLPLVAAASQGPAALVRDGDDGLLVPPDDAPALAEAARRLLDDGPLRDRLRRHGLERIEAEFSEAAVTAQWRALFYQYGAL